MYERILENYVEQLYQNQNMGACPSQMNLTSRKEYYEMIKPVIEALQLKKDASIEELRTYLFEQSGIENKIKEFVYGRQITPGLVLSYGTTNYTETLTIGNAQEVNMEKGKLVEQIEPIDKTSIFDLASITKTFTSLSILKLASLGMLDLNDEAVKYAPQFSQLKGVTIFDALTFRVPLGTSQRVDTAGSREEAESRLFAMEVVEKTMANRRRLYSDMGAMVLKYVIENVSGLTYYDFLKNYILNEIGLEDIYVQVPQEKMGRVVTTNYGITCYNDGNISIQTNAYKGVANDPKAIILEQEKGNLSGHAGLFASATDMSKLAISLIKGQLLPNSYVANIGKNQTGEVVSIKNNEKLYSQYLGLLTYSKHPIPEDSEVFHPLSGKTFASAGFTGTHLTVDSINQVYSFLGACKTHNRVMRIDPAQRDKVQVQENGKQTILLPNGEEKIASYRYAWIKDEYTVKPALTLSLQYKILEDLFSYQNEIPKQNIKKL